MAGLLRRAALMAAPIGFVSVVAAPAHAASSEINTADTAWMIVAIGGLTGTLLAGVFATSAIGGTAGLIEGHPQQLLIQLYGVAVTFVWSAGVSFVLLKLVGLFVPLRVSREHELEGLDISQHGEALQ
jgi:ammonia channel protein AmtB